MSTHLRRLLTTGAAYQVADVVSKVIAVGLLPVYTRELTRADYGTAEVLLTVVILGSIVVRLGLGEALVRFHYADSDPARRRRLARTATGVLLFTTTLAAAAVALLASPLSELVLGASRPGEMRAAALGLWAFTNLELAYALLRVDERGREYATAALTNVALTVGLTVWLVVVRDEGALGLLLGNFGASAIVLIGLWIRLRDAFGAIDRSQLREMLRFGLPTVPAEVSVFALFFIDRLYLYREAGEAEAGLYSLSVKLAAVVIFTVRAFQLAWPPSPTRSPTTTKRDRSTPASRRITSSSRDWWWQGWR
nr:oligosaccharide flippase family protein [Solirubrobacterales bacterium]